MPSLRGPILSLILAPIFMMGLYQSATDAQNGVRREFTGRRAGLRKLLAAAGEALGPTGSLVVGGVLIALALVWLVITIKQRQSSRGSS